MTKKKINLPLIIFSLLCFNIYAQQIDTIYVKSLIGKNSFFRKDSINKYDLKIVFFQQVHPDSANITFELFSTDEWNKINMPLKAYFNGLIIKNKVLYFNGSFSYSILNRNNRTVSNSGIYVYDKLEGIVSVKTPDYYISKTFYKNGLMNGLHISYYGDDKETINQISFYFNDTLNGEAFQFYKNGLLEEKAYYNMGKKNGFFTSYYDTGNKKWQKSYVNDLPKGKAIEYYESGKIKCEGEYSGNWINISIECDTCIPSKFVFRNQKNDIIDMMKTYSIEFKKEIAPEMRTWGLKEKIKYPLKKGIWIHYDESGNVKKKVLYSIIGDAKVF